MSLIDRISNRTKIGVASMGILLGGTGCTTNDSTAYYGASQIYAAGSQNAATAGNTNVANGLGLLSNIAGFMATGAQQKEAAEAGRTQVVVNNAPRIREKIGIAVDSIPFNPNHADLKMYRKYFVVNVEGRNIQGVDDERYVYDKGEIINLWVGYPKNREPTRIYAICYRNKNRNDTFKTLIPMSTEPPQKARIGYTIDSSTLPLGEYEFFVYSSLPPSEDANSEARIEVLIKESDGPRENL